MRLTKLMIMGFVSLIFIDSETRLLVKGSFMLRDVFANLNGLLIFLAIIAVILAFWWWCGKTLFKDNNKDDG